MLCPKQPISHLLELEGQPKRFRQVQVLVRMKDFEEDQGGLRVRVGLRLKISAFRSDWRVTGG